MIGASPLWPLPRLRLIGSRPGLEKLATDTRHDRSLRAGVSAKLSPQSNRRARRSGTHILSRAGGAIVAMAVPNGERDKHA